MNKKLKILAFAGSLRKSSYNKSVLRTIENILQDKVNYEIYDLEGIPLFNEDVEAKGMPEKIKEFRDKVAQADGVIISSPEYNYSITGVLKNAIDWLSRRPNAPLDGKPLAILGASTGMFGTVRSQLHLRQILLAINAKIMTRPEIYINQAQTKFDEAGNLFDEKTMIILQKFAEEFYNLVNNTKKQ